MHDHNRSNHTLAFVLGALGLALTVLVLPVAADGQVFVLALPGSCTDELTIAFAGATAGSSVEMYRASSAGTDTVPSGACGGTALGLANPQLAITLTADGSGGFSTGMTPPLSVCGQQLQAVDMTTCAVSNVARLASGYPAPVAETGQDLVYGDRDDGILGKGVSWPDPRFTDNLDGTVTDNLTGLVWLQDAKCFGLDILELWEPALASANGLASGQCGLTDDSAAGDWRLPNLHEIQSLLDYGEVSPALPEGHPFSGVAFNYWSSTTDAFDDGIAWFVNFNAGYVGRCTKIGGANVLPVRSGQ